MKFPPIMVTNSAKSPTVNEPSRMSGAARARSMAVVTTTVLPFTERMRPSRMPSFRSAVRRPALRFWKCSTARSSAFATWMAWTAPRNSPREDETWPVVSRLRRRTASIRPPSALVKPKTSTPGSSATTVINGSIVAIM